MEKIYTIETLTFNGLVKIIDNTHFMIKQNGSDGWSWAYHIGQASDDLMQAFKEKRMLKDDGKFFLTENDLCKTCGEPLAVGYFSKPCANKECPEYDYRNFRACGICGASVYLCCC